MQFPNIALNLDLNSQLIDSNSEILITVYSY